MIVRGAIDVNGETSCVPRHANAAELVAFGLAVQKRRRELKLSQEALADSANIDRSYMSSIERGLQNIGIVLAARIASTLQLSLADLVSRADL
jgi:transcriptional regulator with XRE-family HTH domain